MKPEREIVEGILNELPEGVELVAVVKGRPIEKIIEVVDSGVSVIGINYIREAHKLFQVIGKRAEWHYIGISRLEKHELLRKKSLEIFNMIETVDSIKLAEDIDRKCSQINKVMPILIEVNIARESQKSGVDPEKVENVVREISGLKNVRVMGLMTMGPLVNNPENLRPYFRETRSIFDYIKSLELPNVEMRYLSMGMSNSYRIAIEEGANIVRIGTKLFENL